jgi:hypothetical protein
MMQFYAVVALASFLLLGVHLVHGFSSGAPVCTVGEPAPGDPHQRGAALTFTGTLASAGFSVTFDDVDISTLPSIEVKTGTPVKVEVIANGVPLKGVLVIVSRPSTDLSGALSLSAEESALLQVSQVCSFEIKAGVTHMDESFKTMVSSTLSIDEPYADLKLDVNVVVQNNETGSYYYYDQYTFASVGPSTGGGTEGGCGLFGLSIFCPFTFCGFFGRLLLGDRDC